MTEHHLTRSRHQTVFYFRRRIPRDLRDLFATSMVTESLGTTHRPTAIIRARLRAALTDALFERLRAMPPIDRNKIRPLTIATAFHENGQLQAFSIDAKPDEADLTATILGGLSTLIREAQQPEQLPKTFIDRSPLRSQAAKTILETFEEYKAEKIRGGYWKDGEDTARYDHLPHIRALIETIGDKPISDVTADDIAAFQSKVFTSDTGAPRKTSSRPLLVKLQRPESCCCLHR